VIPHPKISRNHAMIRMLGQGEYYLMDAVLAKAAQ
jgi:hypothetical protein